MTSINEIKDESFECVYCPDCMDYTPKENLKEEEVSFIEALEFGCQHQGKYFYCSLHPQSKYFFEYDILLRKKLDGNNNVGIPIISSNLLNAIWYIPQIKEDQS